MWNMVIADRARLVQAGNIRGGGSKWARWREEREEMLYLLLRTAYIYTYIYQC